MMAQTNLLALGMAVLAGRCAGAGSHITTVWGGAGTSLCIGADVEQDEWAPPPGSPEAPEFPEGLQVYLEPCANSENLLTLFPIPPDNGTGPVSESVTGNIPWDDKGVCVVESAGSEEPDFEVDQAVLVSHGTNHIVTKWVNNLIAQNGVDDFLGRRSIAEAFAVTTSPTLQLFYGANSWFLNDDNLAHGGREYYSLYGGYVCAGYYYGEYYEGYYSGYYGAYGYYYHGEDHNHEDGGPGYYYGGNSTNHSAVFGEGYEYGGNSSGYYYRPPRPYDGYYYNPCINGYGYSYYYGQGSQQGGGGDKGRRLQKASHIPRYHDGNVLDANGDKDEDASHTAIAAPAVSLRGLFPAPPRDLVLGPCDGDSAWFSFESGTEGKRIKAASGNYLARKKGGLSEGTKVVTLQESDNDYWEYDFEQDDDEEHEEGPPSRRLEENGKTIHV